MQGAEYVYETNWGEQLSSVVHPLPVVMNLSTEECTVLDTSEIGDISCKYLHNNVKLCGIKYMYIFMYIYVSLSAVDLS